MAPLLELLCLASGGDFCDVFAVEVPTTGRVTHLMGPIELTSGIPSFKLYRVSVFINTKLKDNIASCKQELLLPHNKLSTVFPELHEGHLHILVKPCDATGSVPSLLSERPDSASVPIQGGRRAGGVGQRLIKHQDPEAKNVLAPVISSGRGAPGRHKVVSVRSPGRACDNCKNLPCEWVLDGSKCAKCMHTKKACLFDGENSRVLAHRTLTAAALRAGGQGMTMGVAKAGGFGGRGQPKGGKGGLGVDRMRVVKSGREGRGKMEDSVIVIESDDDVEMVAQPAQLPRRVGPTSQRKGQAEGTAVAGAVRERGNAGAPVHRALRHRAEIEAEREVVRRELSYRRSQIRVAETQIRGLLNMQAELEEAGGNML
ncbi:hypothetical protein BD779DRAFT_1675180 [Infundibulicybe gibba]|nr:hypothetical protein BD779DRAFT_1675180 [Infundibulicybe gibba]